MANAVQLKCPAGTTLQTKDQPRQGGQAVFCALPDGARQGPYTEWSQGGRQVVWGNFDAGQEVGVWAMDVPTLDGVETAFVVFDHGTDITEKLLEELPPKCETWKEMSQAGRAGVMAYLTLDSIRRLTGEAAELASNRAAIGACIATDSAQSAETVDQQCIDAKKLDSQLQKAVVSLAQACILQSLE